MEEMIAANLASIAKMYELMAQIPDSIGTTAEKEIAQIECLHGLYSAFANLGLVPEADAEEVDKIIGIVNGLGVSRLVE